MTRRMRIWTAVFLMAFMAAGAARAADDAKRPSNSLTDVIAKGLIEKWLVCGAFSTGVQGGMTGMIVAKRAELTTSDQLAAGGGELGIEPSAGMQVDRGGGKTLEWTAYTAKGNVLDLGESLSKAPEGVMYAAAWIESDREAWLFLELESVTGVSVWMNHEPVFRSKPGVIGEVGKARVTAALRPGMNLLLLKFAGIRYDRAAKSLQQPIEVVRNFVRGISPPLADTTGMSLSLRVSPLLRVGKSPIAVQARIQPTGWFRGNAAKPRMEFFLNVANNSDRRVEGARITVECKACGGKVDRTLTIEPRGSQFILDSLPLTRGMIDKTLTAGITAKVGADSLTIYTDYVPTGRIPERDQNIYVIPGFHADPVWIEDQRDYSVSLLGSARQNMYLTGVDPNYGVYMSEMDYLKPFYDSYPEFREPLKQQIKERRVGTGGSYSQPVEKMISGEALIRNLLYGKVFAEKVLGDAPRVYMGWDIFGHVAQLSQILAKTRNDGAMWSKGIVGFPPIFWHEALDGTRLLHKRTAYGSDSQNIDGLRGATGNAFREFESYGLNVDARLDASDFKPPTPWYAGNTGELRSLMPSIQVSGTGGNRFFQGVLDDIKRGGGRDIPVTSRDMSYYHQGTGLSRVDLKIGNRLAENSVQNAEKFAAVASLMGMPYPDKLLDKAWRQLLFGQHHDALTGTINDRSFLDLMSGYRESIELSAQARNAALGHIGRQINTAFAPVPKDAIPLGVFNPLAWERLDIVRAHVRPPVPLAGWRLLDAGGKTVPYEFESLEKDKDDNITEAVILFAAKVPSLGYSVYYVAPQDDFPTPALRTEDTVAESLIQNDQFRISVDPERGGGIVSLFDLRNNKELILEKNGVGNDIVRIKEDAGRHEPPWEIYTIGDNRHASDKPAEVTAYSSLVSRRLVIRGKVGDTDTVREIIIYQGVPRIDFVTRLEDYRGSNVLNNELFAVTFPVDIRNSVPVFEERFGAVTKKKSRQKLVFQTWQMNNYSDHGMATAHQWMDESWSTALRFITPSGTETAAWPIGMAALITDHNPPALRASTALLDALTRKGISCTPWYDDNDAERMSKLPQSDTTMPADMNKDLAYGTTFRVSFNLVVNNRYTNKVFAALDPATVATFESRAKTMGSAVMLVMDPTIPKGWPAVPALIVKARTPAMLDAAVKRMTDSLAQRGDIVLPSEFNAAAPVAGPENYGVGMLNIGNILNSVENDDTLVMFLVHTASIFRRLPYEFVPESKTNAFTYSLFPHKGNWKDARTYRAGFEFNNPLEAMQLEIHGGALPAKGMAFLTVEPENLVVTAVKPTGNPTASMSSKQASSANGVTVRLYEAEGKPVPAARIRFAGGISKAWSANMLEEKLRELPLSGGDLRTSVGAFSIETYSLTPGVKLPVAKAPALREVELAQPVFARFWTLNSGAAPIGNLPVSVIIQGDVKTKIHIEQGGVTINEIFVTVNNDYTDREISGVARLQIPDDWRALPATFNYKIKPGGHQTQKVVLCFLGSGREGLIKAQVEHDGQTIEDVMEIGSRKLELKAARKDNVIRVELANPYPQRITGQLDLIGPVETWGRDLAGGFGVARIEPRAFAVSLDPGDRKTFEFRLVSETPDSKAVYPLNVKLSYNGRVEYQLVPAE